MKPSRMLCTILCAALLLATTPTTADPVDEVGPATPSVVRLPDCGTVEAIGRPDCRCPAGTVTCLDRDESKAVIVIKRKLDRCEVGLAGCRDKSVEPVKQTGWDPVTVTVVAASAVIAIGALAFAGGYMLSQAEQAGKIDW